MLRRLLMLGMIFGVLLLPRASDAGVITFDSIKVGTDASGNDTWEYSFFVNDWTFGSDDGFTIFFDPTPNLMGLKVTTPQGWDTLVGLPSDPSSARGGYFFDALLLGGSGPFALPFVAEVTLAAGMTLAAPLFDIYELNDLGEPIINSTGIAQPLTPVPEPGTLLLLGTGVAVLARRARRRPTTPVS
jgi:hypothetical protein